MQVLPKARFGCSDDNLGSLLTRLGVGAEVDWKPQHLRPSAWLEHIPFAFWIVRSMRPRCIVELGTHTGVSYFAFCQAVERLNLPTRCYAVDTWKGDQHAGEYSESVYQDVHVTNGANYCAFSSLLRMRFDEALSYFNACDIDLLHIDGVHTYQAVSNDFSSWRPKLSKRAVVVFHDTNGRERDFGVWRLWEELKADFPHFEFHHGHGLGILGVGEEFSASLEELFSIGQDEDASTQVRALFATRGIAARASWQLVEAGRRSELLAAELHGLRGRGERLELELCGVRDRREQLERELPDARAALLDAQQHAARVEEHAQQVEYELATTKEELAQSRKREACVAAVIAERHELAAKMVQFESERAALVQEREAMDARGQVAEEQLQAVIRSTSWRITRLIRAPVRLLRREPTAIVEIRQRLGRFAQRTGLGQLVEWNWRRIEYAPAGRGADATIEITKEADQPPSMNEHTIDEGGPIGTTREPEQPAPVDLEGAANEELSSKIESQSRVSDMPDHARPQVFAWDHIATSLDPSEDFFTTPIFIQNFNQVSYLRKQVQWLLSRGYRNICIVDNGSFYEPLLRFYDELRADTTVRVIRRAVNEPLGKLSLWNDAILEQLGVTGPFVYSDSDVVPDEQCPADVVAHLAGHLRDNPELVKAGLGLHLDDLPVSYKFRDEVIAWESQFWSAPVARGVFFASIDTTFALYRPGARFAMGPAVRTGLPYCARHEPWYVDSANPSEEQLYYTATIEKTERGHWSRDQLPAWLKAAAAARTASSELTLLHLGCGVERIPGWINLDVSPDVKPDIVFDLEACTESKLPIDDDCVDGFFMCHVFEHIERTLPMMQELYRIAKADARFVIRLPHGASNSAFEDPTHRRPYFPNSFLYFAQPAYSRADYNYTGDWRIARIKFVVDPQLLSACGESEVLRRINQERNMVREMIVELRAVKPSRPREFRLLDVPTPTCQGSPIDLESAF
jgi:SAM-dependent methyltransferase